VLIAPQTNPDHNNPLNWRTGTNPNPGTSDSVSFASWQTASSQPDPNADTDGDGLSAFLEYALGSDPSAPSVPPLPTLTRQPDGSALYVLTLPPTPDDARWEIQNGSGLTAWHPATATLISRTTSAGLETFTFTIPACAFNDQRRYWRTRFWLR